jgi:hypothetical protein
MDVDIGNERCGDVGNMLSNERRVLRLCDGVCLPSRGSFSVQAETRQDDADR